MSVVFVAGGTGYLGRNVLPRLLSNRHRIRCVVRPGSEFKLPSGCEIHVGDALRSETYERHVHGCDTFLHLVGERDPNPREADQFKAVDLQSCRDALTAARNAGVRHFVYVSVAHPAPVMKAYVEVRAQCENLIRASGLNATILRPWYVLGPGRRWPYALLPLYWIAARFPSLRDDTERLGLVTLDQMLRSLVWSVQIPARGIRVMEVPHIRTGRAHEDTAIAALAS